MANPNLVDDTGWAGLSTTAKNGDLMLEPGIAEQAALFVEDALNSIVGVQSWIQQNLQTASPTVANTTSGTDLAGVFHKKIATDLVQRMEKHRTILTDMGNAFVEAGKAYAAAEGTSAENFGATSALSNISFNDPAGTTPPGAPFVQALPPRGTPNWPDTPMDSISITPEHGTNLSWQQLYSIGQSIDAQAVANAGGVWYWLAQIALAPVFTKLNSKITSVRDKWTGNGATASINATTKYTSQSKVLTDDMNKLGDLLIFTADWLQNTKLTAPPTPNPPTTDGTGHQLTPAAVETMLQQYQTAFTTNYHDNFTGTTSNVVKLSEATDVTDGTVNNGNPDITNANPDDFTTNYGSTTPPDTEYTPSNGNSGNTGDNTGGYTGTGDTGAGTGDPATTTRSTIPGGGESGTGDSGTGTGENPPVFPTDTSGETTDPGLTDPLTNALATNPDTGTEGLPTLPTDPLADPSAEFPGMPMMGNPMLGGAAGDLARAERSLLSGLGGKGGLGGGNPLAAEEKLLREESKLFPRSKLSLEGERLGRAGAVEGREPNFPFGGSPAGKKDEEKERKRSELLNSTEHLDEAIGELDPSIRPVLDR
ncbi:hypothetical protein [Nocardia aurantia]|uniref:PPE family domain-containing protein n=1 Tax=Nocardia aurantia TaxID=2585199 RepID=A0A7K0DGP0_9NOCA|nr:hypothetical protein [Nocardia aurantia]MQY24980.1 hypothetical protein [Nocardia aurantia]